MSERDLLALGQHVREREDHLLAGVDPDEATRRHLAEYVARRPSQRTPVRRNPIPERWRQPWLGLALAAAAAAAVALAFFTIQGSAFSSSPLTFSVGPSARAGVLRAWESAPAGGSLPIRFSDGTLVDLEADARARVVALGSAGAEIVIESGRAHVDVVPVRGRARAKSPWRVSTGPFSVEVKGTRFDVAWDPAADSFALDLFEGSVIIKGCGSVEGHAIVAGQSVRASCARREWSVAALAASASSARADVSTRSASQQPPPDALGPSEESDPEDAGLAPVASQRRAAARTGAAARERGEPERRSWQELGRAGHFRQAYARAVRAGFAAECERGSAGDLMLLGDAARLSGDAERARQAYLALRRRFPSGAAAARAAFALGRLSVEAEPRAAARWFDVYLREQPDGPLAQAALERLLELTSALGDGEWQREVARRYLARYPSGPHAEAAVQLLEGAASGP